jgi:predicted DNA-binding protein (MmcQ/YjbR family)
VLALPDFHTSTPFHPVPTPAEIRDQLRDFALTLPGAAEEFPWGESVIKVNKKIFIFLGGSGDPDPQHFGLKLADSHELALAVPGAAPSGYGLGRSGWVTVPLSGDIPPVEVFVDWVEESYRLVAPKRLVALLDAAGV